MPTYEYRCKTCGEHLEVVQSFTEDALTDCPSCGAAGQLRKVFGSIGITFKGSGFYKTDNRSGAAKSSGSPSEPKTDSSSTTESSGSSGSSGASDSSSSKSDSSSSSTSAA
jgi:putative FmdB family regulatory protein